MGERARYDEDFFLKYSKEVPVDKDLPFKLQKRALLGNLGFPLDDSRLIHLRDLEHSQISKLITARHGTTTLLLGIHLRPMPTIYTPHFLVDGDQATYRDEFGNTQIITVDELFGKMGQFPPQTWIEITELLWGATTVAGRLIYFSHRDQLIELQKGVMPKNIGKDREKFPYFIAELLLFEPPDRIQYGHLLRQSGFKRTEIESIVDSLARRIQEFEVLKRISDSPTLEFAYTAEKGLVVVDIDWAKQYR